MRQHVESIILAIKRVSGETVLEPGDALITVGRRVQLDKLHAMASP